MNCSDTATVYITINPVPDCPIPNDDIYYVTEGESITIDTCITTFSDPGTGYTNWDSGEPNQTGNENYGEIIFPGATDPDRGKWNDITSSNNKKYLLEVDKLITTKSGHTFLGQHNGHSYFKSNLSFGWIDS